MPSTNQYDSKVLVYVKPFSTATFLYGFMSNAKSATRTAVGAKAVEAGKAPANLVLGCNAPKPGRASRFSAGQYESCYYDFSKYNELRAAQWSTTKPTVRAAKKSALSQPVYLEIKGVKYAWRMSASQFTRITTDELAALGIKTINAGDTEYVWGCRDPKPPKVGKTVADAGGKVDTLSTFCDPAKLDTLPEGWQSLGGSKTTKDPNS